MKSYIASTLEMDDMKFAAKELSDKISKDFQLLSNSCGILFCNSHMEHNKLIAELEESLPFDIIGCTALANAGGKEGLLSSGAALTVLTADDCEFSIAVSDSINSTNVVNQIKQTYSEAFLNLEEDCKLIFALPPYNLDIMLDIYPEELSKLTDNKIPIIGGLTSNTGTSDDDVRLTIARGEVYDDSLVLLLISGNVKPVFTLQNVVSGIARQKRPVTSSKENVIYKVGDQRFTDYIQSVGLDVKKLNHVDSSMTFLSCPLLLENSNPIGTNEIPIVRVLHKIDLEEGSGTAIGLIPEGSTLSVCSLRKEDINASAKQALKDAFSMIEENEKEGYTYSTIIFVSCIGRYMLMVPKFGTESKILAEGLPPQLNLSGFYASGEICPTSYVNGKAINRAHNESLTICAF